MRFLHGALKNLDRIYGFVGGLSRTDDVDLGPIQLVHDVSREGELASAPGSGLWNIVGTNVHAGAGGISLTINPYTSANRRNGYTIDPTRDWVWLIGGWARLDAGVAANLTSAAISISTPTAVIGLTDNVQTTVPRRIAIFFDEVIQTAALGSSIPLEVQLPAPIFPPDGDLRFESIETGGIGITIDFGALVWVGRQSIYPPGLY